MNSEPEESGRLAALQKLGILDTPPESNFDGLAELAAQLCGTPIALITLVDEHRQWFKSRVGLDVTETPREVSFCAVTIQRDRLMEVRNALEDPRFSNNPLVTGEPHIRFYAGAPLITREGFRLGTVAVIDREPRELTEGQRSALIRLAEQVVREIEMRQSNRRLRDNTALEHALIDGAPTAIISVDATGGITRFNRMAERMLGYTAVEMVGRRNIADLHLASELANRAQTLTRDLGRKVKATAEVLMTQSAVDEPESREWTYVDRQGQFIPVLVSTSALRDENGVITGYVHSARELAARRKQRNESERSAPDDSVGTAQAPPDLPPYAVRFVVLATAYAALCWLGIWLRTPPLYSTSLWPAAGLALAGLLNWGWRCWPAIAVGYIFYHGVRFWDNPEIALWNWRVTVMGIGAAVQAVAGALMTARLINSGAEATAPLTSQRSIRRFLFLAGPVACLISATTGVLYLYGTGALDSEAVDATWLTWWVGDSVGVLLFAPFFMLLFPGTGRWWKGQRFQLVWPLVAASVVLVASVIWFHHEEELEARQKPLLSTELVYKGLGENLKAETDVMHGLQRYFEANPAVSPQDFALFTAASLDRPGMTALAWLPRLSSSDGTTLTAALPAADPDPLRMAEQLEAGQVTEARDLAAHAPIRYIEPRERFADLIGLDLLNDSRFAVTIEQAERVSGLMAGGLWEAAGGKKYLLLLYPVNGEVEGGGSAGKPPLRGYVVGLIDLAEMCAPLVEAHQSVELAFALTDVTTQSPGGVLFEVGMEAAEGKRELWSKYVQVPGRVWRLQSFHIGNYWIAGDSPGSRLFLGIVLVFVFLFSMFVLVTAGRQRAIAREVARRTEELDEELIVRRTIEADLAESQNRLRDLFDHSSDLISVVSPEGRFHFVNRSWRATLGYSEEELPNLDVNQVVAPESQEKAAEMMSRILRGEELGAIQVVVITKAGRRMTLESTANVRWKDGKPVSIRSISRDITARLQAEAERREGEERFTRLFHATPVATFLSSLQDGLLIDVNDEFLRSIGKTREQVVGRYAGELDLWDEASPSRDELLTRLLEAGSFRNIDIKRRVGAEIVEVSASAALITMDGRRCVLGTFLDITARKRAESEVRQSEENLAVTLNSIGDAVLATDIRGMVTRSNPVAEHLTGWSSDEAKGRPVGEVFRIVEEGTRAPALNPVTRVLATGQIQEVGTSVVLISRDEVEHPIAERASPIHDAAGATIGAVLVFRDVTEERKAARKLHASEAYNRSIVESGRDCLLILDLAGRMQDMAEPGRRLMGVENFTTIREQAWSGLWTREADQQAVQNAIEVARQGGSGRFQGFTPTMDGTPKWWDVLVSPILGESGQPERLLAVSRDITQQREAEERVRILNENLERQVSERTAEVRDSEVRFRAIFEQAALGIAEGELENNQFVAVNKQFAEILGYTVEELQTKTFEDYTYPDDLAEDLAKFDQLRNGVISAYSIEKRYIRKDGSLVWVNITVSSLDLRGNRAKRCMAIVEDITERKQIENVLREKEYFLSEAQRIGRIGSWSRDINGRVTRSEEVFRIYGVFPDDLTSDAESFFDLVHPEDVAEVRAWSDAIQAGHETKDIEFRHHLADGSVRYARIRGELQHDQYQRPVRIVGTVQDITEEKEAKAALEESERRYRRLFDRNPQPMWVYDTETTRFLAVNDAAIAHYGYSREEFLGMRITDIRPPEDVPKLEASIKQDRPGLTESGVWRHRLKGGRIINANVVSHGLDFMERPARLVLADDVTDRKKTEEALIESERFARASFNALAAHVAVLDVKGTIIASNDSWNRFAQMNGGEWQQMAHHVNYLSVCDRAAGICSEEAPLVAAGIRDVIAGRRKEFSLEYPCHSETERRWFVCRVTRFPGKGPVRVVVAHENVTAIKLVEGKLRQQQELNRLTLENLVEGVVVCDQDGRLIVFNRVAREWHGADPRVIPPEKWAAYYDLFEGDGVTPLTVERIPLMRAFAGERVVNAEMSIVRKDRPPRVVLANAAPLLNEEKTQRGAVVVMRDITEQREADQTIRRSLREKEILLKEIHHRVKNNLQIISSLLDMQIDFTREKGVKLPLLESANRVRAMATIHERLYRSQTLDRINFGEYAENLANALFRSYAVKGSVQFIVEASDVELDIATAVPCGLVLNELISNACKHAFQAGDSGQLRVIVGPGKNREFELIVHDSGPGLPENFEAKRASTLGMQLVDTLVRQIKGKLTITDDAGARFHLEVPFSLPPPTHSS